jgi:CDP-diacylglycerol---serine O-phosphatidyltransferase
MTRSGNARVPLLGFFNRSVVLTYAGVVVAVLGMWLAHTARLEGALICLVIAGLADLFDGPLARRVSRDADARRFGQEIDSLADMVSFVALPVVVALGLGVRSLWWVPVLAFYALAGLIRLGYFNTITRADAADGRDGGPIRHYRGVPVTYVALVLPVAALATTALPATAGPWLVGAVIAVMGVLFVLDVPVRKPSGASYAIFAAVAVAIVTALSFAEF